MVTRQRPRSTRLLVVTLVCISLAVITLDYREGEDGPLEGLGRSALAFIAPLQGAVTSVARPVGNFFSGVVHLPSLEQRNRDLERQLRDAQSEIEKGILTQRQLDELSELLALKQTLDPEAVAAVVTGNGVSNFDWSVNINKGSADGIEMDMPVVTGSGSAPMLVGKVIQVSASASTVQLILDRSWAGAGVLGTSEAAGLVEGEGEQDLTMGVPTGTAVTLPEAVYTQGYCVLGDPGQYPPGILVGQVSQTVQVANEIEESIRVRPAVDFATLQFVLVLKTRKSC